MSDVPEEGLVVARCAACGDTFPTEAGADATCPTCGGSSLEIAAEPLL